MNVLLVDDKYDVLQGIAAGVNWSEIGDIKLFFACSGAEALNIIENNIIRLLITDIEMPGMSGLELVEKIKEQKKDIATIFLTSHDSFRYAQSAIRIGCNDYILQPVDYKKLQDAIIKVINMRLTLRIEKDYASQLEEKMNAEARKENAWREIITKVPHYDSKVMHEILEDAQVYLAANRTYLLILTTRLWRKETLDSWTSRREEDGLYLQMKKALTQSLPVVAGFAVDTNQWVIVLEKCEALPYLQLFTRVETKENANSLAIYVSEPTAFQQLPDEYEKLQKLSKDNVGSYEGVFEYRENAESHIDELVVCSELSMQKWKSWLLEGKENQIKEEIEHFLRAKDDAKELDRTMLVLIVQLIINVFYSLEIHSAEKLMVAKKVSDCYVKATDSADDLLAFWDVILEQYKEKMCSADDNSGKSLIRQIKCYIDSHIENRLNRDEIAEKFFISKDYLTHLFLKYEGIGFSQYVCEQKISKAKDLMQETNLPVKAIASNIGIPDYTYFAKLFKKSTGMSANEFRELHKKTE